MAMIDSVCLTLPVRMHSASEMVSLGFRSVCKHPSPSCSHPARWIFKPDKRPYLTWSEAPDRSQWLSLSGSLPRFIFGSNVYLMTSDDELRACLEGISEYVASVAHVRYDSLKANVTRVDYCHDWQLTSNLVTNYLWALRAISLPRMRKTLIDNRTVELSNGSQTVSFYDKFEERLSMKPDAPEELTAARGILRFEARFRDNRSCERHARSMALSGRTGEALLHSGVARKTIRGTLERLGLDKPLNSGSRRFELLRTHYPNDQSKVLKLVGFLDAADCYGLENLVALGICSYTDYRRKLAEVKSAGALHQSAGPSSLSALTALLGSRSDNVQAA